MIQSVSATLTVDDTSYIGTCIRGRVLAVKAVADSSVTNNWDLTLTGRTTGIPILSDTSVANNATTWWHPRQLAANGADGSAATDAFVDIPIVAEQIQAVVANAGAGVITVTVIYDADQNV